MKDALCTCMHVKALHYKKQCVVNTCSCERFKEVFAISEGAELESCVSTIPLEEVDEEIGDEIPPTVDVPKGPENASIGFIRKEKKLTGKRKPVIKREDT